MDREWKKYSDEWLIDRFLRFNSVEAAMTDADGPIPFSYITFRRKLTQAGIVRSPGRHTSLTEALHFFRMKSLSPGTPLEKLYKGMPRTFRTSMETFHRIYDHVENHLTQRRATALIIHQNGGDDILLGRELLSNSYYGKIAGRLSIPMTFSAQNESVEDRVLRVLQQEVFSIEAIEKKFADFSYTNRLLSQLQGPIFTFEVLDVAIDCFELTLPADHMALSSYKLSDHTFIGMNEFLALPHEQIRLGVGEILSNFAHRATSGTHAVPLVTSDLNIALREMVPSLRWE